MANVERITTDSAPRPAGHYSQACAHEGLIFVSGQLPITPEGKVLGDKNFEEQTRQAITAGATIGTHLFNAMRPLASREPGPIAAALEDAGAWFGMIVDGEHVAPAMLQLALRGAGKAMLVTDAMPPVGASSKSLRLYGQPITVRGGRCTTADGTLAGSVLDMASAVRNCVRMLDLPLAEALPLATTAPAAFLGVGGWLGRLAPGYRADLVALDPDTVDVFATWVAGTPSATA